MSDRTLHADLPAGYRPRVVRKLAASSRNRWNDAWDRTLLDLWATGGHSWQRAGFGHSGSGILRAIESRGMVEVAEHPRQPLLVRLTAHGRLVAEGLQEERGTDRHPPTGALLYWKRLPRSAFPARPTVGRSTPTVMTELDAHLYGCLLDEIQAIRESLDRMAEYERDGEIYDREHQARNRTRLEQLTEQARTLSGASA